MPRNRPKGNGPHTIIDRPIYEVDFDCKYFGENYSCNCTGGYCNIRWARLHCKYYEGIKPITAKKKNKKLIKSTNDKKENKEKSTDKLVYISKDGMLIRVPEGAAKVILSKDSPKKPSKPKAIIIKNDKQKEFGKYIVDDKRGIGRITGGDHTFYNVKFIDLNPVAKIKISIEKINKIYDTYQDAKEVLGYSFKELDIKANDYFEIDNKRFKIKTITSINIILSDGTVIPTEKTKFNIVDKVNTIKVLKKIK